MQASAGCESVDKPGTATGQPDADDAGQDFGQGPVLNRIAAPAKRLCPEGIDERRQHRARMHRGELPMEIGIEQQPIGPLQGLPLASKCEQSILYRCGGLHYAYLADRCRTSLFPFALPRMLVRPPTTTGTPWPWQCCQQAIPRSVPCVRV